MNISTLLEIITPEEMFFSGQVEMVVVSTYEGQEGYMANHAWCCKLLAEEGIVKIRESESGKQFKIAEIKGGYIDVKDHIVIYTDQANWK